MLFVHDHTFVNKDGNLYTTGSLNQKIMDRYKGWFGDVSVFANTRKATLQDEVLIRPENYVHGLSFNLIEKSNSLIHLIKIRKKIEEAVKNTDCVVIRMSVFGAIAVHYARKYKVPYMIEMVACPWDSLWYHSLKGKIVAPFMTILTKSICKKAPRVLYVTNVFLQKRYPTNGFQIGCSDVELNDIKEEVLDNRLSMIQSIDLKKTIKLCTVANVGIKYKGQGLVIQALRELKKSGINCEYYLIGGGDSTRLINIAKKYGVEGMLHVMGPKPHNEIFDLLDEMDIYVQPSLQEGLPRAVIEAMSRACPIIGSSTGGIPELILPECVFKKGKKHSFVIALTKLLNKQKMIESASVNFKNSYKYEKKYLDIKREKFYLDFINSIRH